MRLILFMAVALSCASQRPPSGGPTDTIPPEIVSISPAAGSIHVSLDSAIEIDFSEQVTKKSVEDAIFLSPWPSEDINYRWRGKKLKIEFGDSLKSDKTYVLTIGAQTSDLRNNKMRDSFSIAFSTGDKIDAGQIVGTVYGSSAVEGMLVCAYQVQEETPPDPTVVLADYYTQCNKHGDYTLMYVAPGTYRVFAFGDKDRSRKYTRGVDNIGVPNSDVNLTEENLIVRGVDFQVTLEDTIVPQARSAYSLDNSNVALRFSEAIASFNTTAPDNYFVIATEQNQDERLPIYSCYQNSVDPSQVHFSTATQSAIPYIIYAQNIFDLAGNAIDDTAYFSVVFEGKTEPDTLKPKLVSKSVEDSSKGVELTKQIRFAFSEAMAKESLENHFKFSNQQNQKIPGRFEWINPADFIFHPDSALKSLTGYSIVAPVDSVTDVAGNALSDSLFRVYFKTLNEDTLTAIRGTIGDESEKGSGRFYVSAKSEKHSYNIIVDKPGDFGFEKILPGIYTIYGFRDADSNGVYSFGRAVPFAPAERFVFYTDSIKVRSRWPTEGEDIIFK